MTGDISAATQAARTASREARQCADLLLTGNPALAWRHAMLYRQALDRLTKLLPAEVDKGTRSVASIEGAE